MDGKLPTYQNAWKMKIDATKPIRIYALEMRATQRYKKINKNKF